ncbi:cupin domain-containing protein [Moritella sp. 24]|uniref:cupin domain-containing protein n=1 Tax=Moritella sp. 24 TaxID=2746230 RepID=UPI001BA89974|nr:cupin domain-containing protein [Moritella sp. 24]QUM76914.1 cupin domain-containing protein [Moritella sp. 24]
MTKSTIQYWNTLAAVNKGQWSTIADTNGELEQLTLSMDDITGDYTRLTRFKAGADTSAFGGKYHDYPEEIFIISGRLFDVAFDVWLEAGDYASRPPGEVHGPFICEQECLVLEISYPSQSIER